MKQGDSMFQWNSTMPRKPRKLHIGGKISAVGWEILNVLDGTNVDHTGDAVDLSRFADATFAELYASHGMRIVG